MNDKYIDEKVERIVSIIARTIGIIFACILTIFGAWIASKAFSVTIIQALGCHFFILIIITIFGEIFKKISEKISR